MKTEIDLSARQSQTEIEEDAPFHIEQTDESHWMLLFWILVLVLALRYAMKNKEKIIVIAGDTKEKVKEVAGKVVITTKTVVQKAASGVTTGVGVVRQKIQGYELAVFAGLLAIAYATLMIIH